jgi:hypothetical protein
MAVQLKDAQIRVKLQLSDAKEAVESLEKRTKRQREEAEREERKEKKKERESTSKTRRGMSVLAAGGLVAIFRRVLTSLPFFIGTAAAGGMAVAELGERFGPGGEAAIRKIIAESLGVDVGSITALSDFGDWWRRQKLKLTSIGTAGSQTVDQAAAIEMGGGVVTKEMAEEMFKQNRDIAILMANIAAAARRAKQTAAGAAVGAVIFGAIGDAMKDLGAVPGLGGAGDIFHLPFMDFSLDKPKAVIDQEALRKGAHR